MHVSQCFVIFLVIEFFLYISVSYFDGDSYPNLQGPKIMELDIYTSNINFRCHDFPPYGYFQCFLV